MKQNKFSTAVAGFLSALVLAVPAAVHAVDYGLIHSVFPVAQNGHALRTIESGGQQYWQYDSPVLPGEKIEFVVRVLNRNNHNDYSKSSADECEHWVLKHINAFAPEAWDDANYKLAVGLWIGGPNPVWATLKSVTKAATQWGNMSVPDTNVRQGVDKIFTDITFEYTVAEGDVGLPVRFANETGTGPAGTGVGSRLCMRNLDKWALVCPKKDTADPSDVYPETVPFKFANLDDTYATGHQGYHQWKVGRQVNEIADYDLSKANFCAEGAGFDKQFADAEQAVWRTVAQNTVVSSPIDPRIEIAGEAGASDAKTYYVWSSDKDKVSIEGAVNRTGHYDKNSHTATSEQPVLTINVSKGQRYATFKIRGAGNKNDEATLYFSAEKEFQFSGTTLITTFQERKVKVTEKPQPTLQVSVIPGDVIADTNFTSRAAEVKVEISEPHTQDIKVKLETSFIDAASVTPPPTVTDFVKLVRASANWTDAMVTEVTIPQGRTTPLEGLSLHALGAASYTFGSGGIQIKPSFDATDPGHTFIGDRLNSGIVKVTPMDPVVVPVQKTYLNVPGGTAQNIRLRVSDTYRDSKDGNTYTVTWSDAAGTRTYDCQIQAGILNVPVIFSEEGDYTASFTVRNQSGLTSAESTEATINVSVLETQSLTAAVVDGPTTRDEGSEFSIQFTIGPKKWSDAAHKPAYVFLEPLDDVTRNAVSCAQFEQGIPLNHGESVATANAKIITLDGTAATGALRFTPRLRNKIGWNDTGAADIAGVVMKEFVIGVANKSPQVSKVTMSGSTPITTKDSTIRGAVIDTPKQFKVEMTDVAADIDGDVTLTWSFARDGILETPETSQTGKLRDITVANTFSGAGTYQGMFRIRDKDGGVSEDFTFFVEVADTPTVSVVPYIGGVDMTERMVGARDGRFDVYLSAPCTDSKLGVQLVVERNGAGTYPLPELNVNSLTFDKNKTNAYFYVAYADGTRESADLGFTIRATVTNENVNVDGKKYKDIYVAGSSEYFIANENPEINRGSLVITNALPATKNVPVEIDWSVYDIRDDLQNELRVIWNSSEGRTIVVSPDPNTGNSVSAGRFSYAFTSANDNHWLTLTVMDKDGGVATRTWNYKIEISKSLKIYPRGPSREVISSGPYAVQHGFGKGRVTARGALSQIVDFAQEWTYSKTDPSTEVWARGYRVGDVDNGHLAGLNPGGAVDADVPLTTVGGLGVKPLDAATTAGFYAYDDNQLDSFFYCWINTPVDKESGAYGSPILQGNLVPYTPGVEETGRREIGLPVNALANDGGGGGGDAQIAYLPRILEAVFAKERFPEDNVGDLNFDGVPDMFAVKTWATSSNLWRIASGDYGQAAAQQGNGQPAWGFNDVVNLDQPGTYNPDEDWLPAAAAFTGNLIPGVVSDWAVKGQAFTTRMEIRGFHDGLNLQRGGDGLNYNVRGSWISDISFSDAERHAWAHALALNDGLDVEHAEEMENLENRIAALREEWENGPWNHPGVTRDPKDPDQLVKRDLLEALPWSPENRTDPTNSDTDGDGYPDGYEYFFWYKATVGWIEDGEWTRMTGERFNIADITKGTPITPEEIARAFNPTRKADDPDLVRDTDGDGLTDYEEMLIGSNPVHWDTDGDGLSDYWEILNGLNPLVSNAGTDNPDGDFMAIYNNPRDTWQIVRVTTKNDDGEIILVREYATRSAVPTDGAGPWPERIVAFPVFRYDETMRRIDGENRMTVMWVPRTLGRMVRDNTRIVNGMMGMKQTFSDYAAGNQYHGALIPQIRPMDTSEVTLPTADPNSEIEFVSGNGQIFLLHYQVYTQFGFNALSAWNRNSTNHLVNDRWAAGPQGAGVAANTEPFSTRNEYLLLKYLLETSENGQNAQMQAVLDANISIATLFSRYTTLANVPVIAKRYGDKTDVILQPNHGADTDGDGVPDGWELYVGLNPLDPKDVHTDIDGDGLSVVEEFAGTDSCKAYENAISYAVRVEGNIHVAGGGVNTEDTDIEALVNLNYTERASIYDNHPGLATGWYNKFWPTDPNDGDTDCDGLSDGAEGAEWTAFYPDVEKGLVLRKFTFIYGAPEDNGSMCIRGGGLNPCSVDTDGDLLPDAWEHDHAGVAVIIHGYKRPADAAAGSISEAMWEVISRLDGLTVGGDKDDQEPEATELYYIAGGMDGTFGPNAGTDGGNDAGMFGFDPRLGKVRNFDFDQDGLANFQEYLVQTLRHLRYDDSETPLMGSFLEGGLGGQRRHIKFLQMQTWDGAAMAEVATEAGFSGAHYIEVGEGVKAFDYENLGYFTRPRRVFDPASLTLAGAINYPEPGARFLMRPHGFDANAADGFISRSPAMGHASTDPRMRDTDMDGMDDYYEIFHGLNPILGNRDVISEATLGLPNARMNAWTEWQAQPNYVYDAIMYPWNMGMPEADADGDGLRNIDEAIIAGMPNPLNYHTDPTPLWMTDSSSKSYASYTSQYYSPDPYMQAEGVLPDVMAYPWYSTLSTPGVEGHSTTYMFTFEENEGYDTDGDGVPDSFELVPSVSASSDPLDFNDPDRRQALWFDGVNSVAAAPNASMHRYVGENYAMFRQFTAEMWVNPAFNASLGKEMVLLERVCDYPSSTLSNSVGQIRANFRVGIHADGTVYGMYDNGDAVPSGSPGTSSEVRGTILQPEKWTHVAFTYDGHYLTIYQDGEFVRREESALIPANGIFITQQTVAPGLNTVSPTVAEGSFLAADGYRKYASSLFLGARAGSTSCFNLRGLDSLDRFSDFFEGYIDEVRVWDGARTALEIEQSFSRRFTSQDVKNERERVWRAWSGADVGNKEGKTPPFASRNENDGLANLPAELVLHYNFTTLPAAESPANVAYEPNGFTRNVLDNVRVDGLRLNRQLRCGWWDSVSPAVRSSVYSNTMWVPWIRNTCAHLPALDSSVVDSRFWNAPLAGVTYSDEVQLSAFLFPYSMNPYTSVREKFESTDRTMFLAKLRDTLGGAATIIDDGTEQKNVPNPLAEKILDLYWRNRFDLRTAFTGTSNLLPLGGAYARRGETYWDGAGCMDAWKNTGRDLNANELPDWWERYCVANHTIEADGTVKRFGEGTPMTMREAYLRDLVAGLTPTLAAAGWTPAAGPESPFKASNVDRNFDGLPDWWQELNNLDAHAALGDFDGDQLSNYAEYLIGEGFTAANIGFTKLNARSRRTFMDFGQLVPDYFLKPANGRLYYGEMFADHDFMEDAWEDRFDPDFVSRFNFDPWRDADNDGWSNFSECRADTDPSRQNVIGVEAGYVKPGHPEPLLKATVTYRNSRSENIDAPVFIQAYSDLASYPDAIWRTVAGQQIEYYVGYNPQRKVKIQLSPSSIVKGTLAIEFKCAKWWRTAWYSLEDAEWMPLVKDVVDVNNPDKGYLAFVNTVAGIEPGAASNEYVGTVDYVTGEIEVSFDKCAYKLEIPLEAGVEQHYLDTAYIRVKCQDSIPTGNSVLSLNLKRPIPAEDKVSRGAVREGRNVILAFMDRDGDGSWTPGEPMGVAEVDVGWSGASFAVELTDVNPSMMRVDLRQAVAGNTFSAQQLVNDRGVHGVENYELPAESVGTNMPPADVDAIRVRVARIGVNNVGAYKNPQTGITAYAGDVLGDWMVRDGLLAESRLTGEGTPDLDWGKLEATATAMGVRYADLKLATYAVIIGDEEYTPIAVSNRLATGFINRFEEGAKGTQTKAVPVSPRGTVYSGQPEFTWTHTNPIGKSYPAFQLRIWDSTGRTLIYDSGVRRAPARDVNGAYRWKAPVYANMVTPQGKLFETQKNYKWAVSMLDAKFTTPNTTETKQDFRLETSGRLGTISDYGLIEVKVKYFGPTAATVTPATLKKLIRVQAFETPDFTGTPAGEGYVTDLTHLATTESMEVNATLIGLKPGSYYLRAFIDVNGDGVWQREESWGYVNYVGQDGADKITVTRGDGAAETDASAQTFVYTPRACEVAVGKAHPVATIYIEDCDTDNDGLPDAWEIDTYKSIDGKSSPSGSTFFTRVNPQLADTVNAYTTLNGVDASKNYGVLTLMSAMLEDGPESVGAAMMIMGASPEAAAEEVSVRITEFSPASGVKLEVSTAVKCSSTPVLLVNDTATVGVYIEASPTLDFAAPVERLVKTVMIRANGDSAISIAPEELEFAKGQLDNSMFYRAKIK